MLKQRKELRKKLKPDIPDNIQEAKTAKERNSVHTYIHTFIRAYSKFVCGKKPEKTKQGIPENHWRIREQKQRVNKNKKYGLTLFYMYIHTYLFTEPRKKGDVKTKST